MIAATRNNLNSQGEKVDIYLLKVDSLGNYDTTTTVLSYKFTNIKVYPNPSSNYFTIDIPNDFCNSELIVYSYIGKVVLKKQIKSSKTTYNMSNLTSGLYIYEIRKNGVVVNRGKWIKK